jgi:hypothetical protein
MTAQNPILQGNVFGQIAVGRGSWLGRNWKWLLLIVFLGLIALVAASTLATAATPAVSSSTEGIGSGDGEQTGTRVVITELKRGGSTLTLKFTIYNDSNAELDTGGKFSGSGYRENGGRSFSGIHLIDSVSKKKYFVAADSDGNCLCSEGVDDIRAKAQVSLWAKFPAPPDNIQKITVQIPHFIPVDDVPIR